MAISIQLTEADYIEAQRLHIQRTRTHSMIFVTILFFLILIGCSFFQKLFHVNIDMFIVCLYVAYLFCILIYYIMIPWQSHRIFPQQKSLHEPFTVAWNDEGLIITNSCGEVKTPWSHFYQCKHNQKMMLLYHSDIMFYFIPTRYLKKEQGELFQQTVAMNIPKYLNYM